MSQVSSTAVDGRVRATKPNVTWFAELYRSAQDRGLPNELLRHLLDNRDRITATVQFLEDCGLRGKRICEIGPGGVGVASRWHLGARVDGYDCSDWSRPLCDAFEIPWRSLDLHAPQIDLAAEYDAVLMCEVIEHVARWPADVL